MFSFMPTWRTSDWWVKTMSGEQGASPFGAVLAWWKKCLAFSQVRMLTQGGPPCPDHIVASICKLAGPCVDMAAPP